MSPQKHFKFFLFSLLSVFFFSSTSALAWHDKTHLSVAKVAGYEAWYNAAGADLAKLKAGVKEGPNHYVNNPRGTVVSSSYVTNQAPQYDNPNSREGRLYGAIISTVRNYQKVTEEGKYGEYHLAYCAHYIGDLSMPFHYIEHKGFSKKITKK